MRPAYARAIAVVIFLFVICSPLVAFAASNAKPSETISAWDENDPATLKDSNLHGQSAILIDAVSGDVLYDKNSTLSMYPASTTKILTALIALEKCDLDDTLQASALAASTEATYIPVKSGESFSVRDLLYALMLISANDAAVVLAEEIGGSVEGFAEIMNQKAKAVGCDDSNFVTPNGLPSTRHYSTAADMAKIARAAMQNETFRKIVASPSYTIAPTNKNEKSRTIDNKNRMLPTSGDSFSYEWSIGVKTGYTMSSAHTYVGAAERNGVSLICVILGTTSEGKWKDAKKLFEYGFAKYAAIDIAKLYEASPISCSVDDCDSGDSGMLRLDIADPTALSGIIGPKDVVEAAKKDFSNFYSIEYANETVIAPIKEGQTIARLVFSLDSSVEPIIANLVASRSVDAMPEPIVNDPVGQQQSLAQGVPPTFDQIALNASNSPVRYLAFLLLVPIVLLIGLVASMVMEMRRRRRRRNRPSQYYTMNDGGPGATMRRR